jgi:hypothetical protein
LRICRAAYGSGTHPGKEWAGNCYIGYGGKEFAQGNYQVLSLGYTAVYSVPVMPGTIKTTNPSNTVPVTPGTIQPTTPTNPEPTLIYTLPPTGPTGPKPFDIPQPQGVVVVTVANNGFWIRDAAGFCMGAREVPEDLRRWTL